jgi:hypothetical protein
MASPQTKQQTAVDIANTPPVGENKGEDDAVSNGSSGWENCKSEITFNRLNSTEYPSPRTSLLTSMLAESGQMPTAAQPLSPETTRRNALATELSKPLRHHLLLERRTPKPSTGKQQDLVVGGSWDTDYNSIGW